MLTVASIGAINPQDISKVLIAGSVVQLGSDIVGVESAEADAAFAVHLPVLPPISATVRYDVAPEGVTGQLGGLVLQVRYRDGNGRVVATLIEVDRSNPGPEHPDSGTVREQALLQFDSANPDVGGPFTSFRTGVVSHAVFGDPLSSHEMDFGRNAYYIALTLSGPGLVVAAHPPAVSTLGLFRNL
jgi:hypothetical protein